MPSSAPRFCPHPGCDELIVGKQRACPDHQRMREAERTFRMRGRAGQSRRTLFLNRHPLCMDCHSAGRITVATEVDHIVPLSQGGPDEWDNLQGLCHACHAAKTAREMRERMGLAAR